MNVEITGVDPTPPEQRVVLDLTVEEFAMLEHLCFNTLAGNTALRNRIETGFAKAYNGLDSAWRKKVDLARGRGVTGSPSNSRLVQSVFDR